MAIANDLINHFHISSVVCLKFENVVNLEALLNVLPARRLRQSPNPLEGKSQVAFCLEIISSLICPSRGWRFVTLGLSCASREGSVLVKHSARKPDKK